MRKLVRQCFAQVISLEIVKRNLTITKRRALELSPALAELMLRPCAEESRTECHDRDWHLRLRVDGVEAPTESVAHHRTSFLDPLAGGRRPTGKLARLCHPQSVLNRESWLA